MFLEKSPLIQLTFQNLALIQLTFQVELTSANEGVEYADWQLTTTRNPIGQDMLIEGEHMFALSGGQVLKIPTSRCEQHNDCATCLLSADPYCGWCTLSNALVETAIFMIFTDFDPFYSFILTEINYGGHQTNPEQLLLP